MFFFFWRLSITQTETSCRVSAYFICRLSDILLTLQRLATRAKAAEEEGTPSRWVWSGRLGYQCVHAALAGVRRCEIAGKPTPSSDPGSVFGEWGWVYLNRTVSASARPLAGTSWLSSIWQNSFLSIWVFFFFYIGSWVVIEYFATEVTRYRHHWQQ